MAGTTPVGVPAARITQIFAKPSPKALRPTKSVPPPGRLEDLALFPDIVDPMENGKAISRDPTSDDLGKNPPFVFVRGGGVIQLSTDVPDNQDVDWEIRSNPAASNFTPPGLSRKTGAVTELKTDQEGSFVVKATFSGSSLFWNVCLITVRVDPGARVQVRSDVFADHSDAKNANPQAGSFPGSDMFSDFGPIGDPRSKAAMRAQLPVKLSGADGVGNDTERFVLVRILQNGIEDSIQGHYDGGVTGREISTSGIPTLDATKGHEFFDGARHTINWLQDQWQGPLVDSKNDQEPFLFKTPTSFKLEHPSSKEWVLHTLDSPATLVPKKAPGGQLLRSIAGRYRFRTAVAALSMFCPNMIVAVADFEWTVSYETQVTYTNDDPTTAKLDMSKAAVTLDRGVTPIGSPAASAGFELFPPRFNADDGTTFQF